MKKDHLTREKIRKFLAGKGNRGATDAELGALLGITGGPPDMVILVVSRFARELPGVSKRGGVWILDELELPEPDRAPAATDPLMNGATSSAPVNGLPEDPPIEPGITESVDLFGEDPASPWARAVSLQLVPRLDDPGVGALAIAVAGRWTDPRLIHLSTPDPAGLPESPTPDITALAQLRDLLDGAVVINLGTPRHYSRLRELYLHFGERLPAPSTILPLGRIAGALFDLDPCPDTLEELVSALAPGTPVPEAPEDSVALLLDLFVDMEEELRFRGIDSDEKLSAFAEGAAGEKFDTAGTAIDVSFIESLPDTPGVYRMHDREKNLIYVGKASRLKERVSSYLAGPAAEDSRVGRIRELLYSIETDCTGNELEALLEEHRAITSENPLLNVQMEIHPSRDHPFTSRPTRVHDRPIVIFLPSCDEDTVSIFGINRKKGFSRISARIGEEITVSDVNRIWRTVSPSRRKKDRPFTGEMEIVLRWIESNLDYYPHIPVPALPGKARLRAVINAYLAGADPERDGGMVLL